ncbi:NAD(P)-binding domain-containing protein [Rhizobium halophilum]|uniref:NAD(P)-binding domain-containing protein n=1 Tax=Rhizobium halophilum TaxID=2846852 RepID=UPI001EFD37EA|nr:NAD(P)-binding domain-containing protein [Rhizobium halophilum]MCF6369910.1 NAD(P)-binding domain-containing protein [Rhizobium halophilum]
MEQNSELPVGVIGAGPVGLAAAAHLIARGIRPMILEKGPSAGSSLRDWSHVRVFSPWRYIIDSSAAALLSAAGWKEPDMEALPTGDEIITRYLKPLAGVPQISVNTVYGATVTSVTRQGLDKLSDGGRGQAPFVIRFEDADGNERRITARAVLDASGTWDSPNPLGIDGLPVPCERQLTDKITYGIPDVSGRNRADYAGATVLVVGSGHSAINAVVGLMEVQEHAPQTRVLWGLRRNRMERLLGGGLNDQLPARGNLGLAASRAIESGRVQLLAPLAIQSLRRSGDRVEVEALQDGVPVRVTVDRIIVTTGSRPNLDILRELRLDLDPAVEAPRLLAPMIDPNVHSCGTVPPHGVMELMQPERGFFIVGSKSYGRAPTFLMATGYEQVRSVAAELAGDVKAAREVHLVLPETGVCSAGNASDQSGSSAGCCGGPAPIEAEACCQADLAAKAEGKSGCGCGSTAKEPSLEPAE